MADQHGRICDPVSRAELERRWAAVRALMPEQRLDALVIQGASNLAGTGGYFRWFTGISAFSSYIQTVIFPRESLMTMVAHGAHHGETKLDGTDPIFPGIGLQRFTPAFPGVDYCAGYDAELAAEQIRKEGYRRIGLVAPNNMLHGFGATLHAALGGVEIVDATDLVDPVKAVKSAEEIELLRRTAAMQDEILVKTRAHIRPGMKEYEVTAYSSYVGSLMGSATGYFLAGSAPPGEAAPFRLRPFQNRTIREGDVLLWQAENTGPGGLFVHMGRILTLGKAPQELVDLFGKIVEAQDFTVSLLRAGADCAELFAEYQAYMRSRGLREERRVHCHGQGYDVVERPLLRHDETMKLGPNMNIGIHPGHSTATAAATCCDNFLLTGNGVERLHKTPREIIEL